MVSIYQTLSVKKLLLRETDHNLPAQRLCRLQRCLVRTRPNLSNAYLEKRSTDGQCSIGVGPNVSVWNE